MLKDKADGQTGTKIFLDAMSKDKVHLARFVLDALDGEIVDSKTDDAQTPLISSVLLPEQTRCKFMELLLQRGASVNSQDGAGRTALSYACEKGYLDAVKILVRNNADPDLADVWGNSALMYAAAAGHYPVVEYLVRAFKRLGLQIDRINKAGNSAVEVAKFLGHRECLCALTGGSKKSWKSTEDAREQPPPSPGPEILDFHKKVGEVTSRLEVLQTRKDALQKSYNRQTKHRIKMTRMPSMDSIEEFQIEPFSSRKQDVVFSGVRDPAPPPRTLNKYANFEQPKKAENLNSPADHLLPPLKRSIEDQKKSLLFPPQATNNNLQPGAPSALDAFTPIITARKGVTETSSEKTLDFGLKRFNESYYRKRCSLPTSMLSPAPPERGLMPARKFRTLRRREGSTGVAPPLQVTSLPASSAASSLSAFRNRLLRRFTSPEIKKVAEDLEKDPVVTSGRIPRSETFPQDRRHPQVASKPSIDSISSVKCEFDFQIRKADQ